EVSRLRRRTIGMPIPTATPALASEISDSSTDGLPELVSAAYERAPTPVRTKFIEYLLGPLGPLALVAIANGAFGHLLYRLRRDAVAISLDDAARITSKHILELARY